MSDFDQFWTFIFWSYEVYREWGLWILSLRFNEEILLGQNVFNRTSTVRSQICKSLTWLNFKVVWLELTFATAPAAPKNNAPSKSDSK